MAVTGLIFIGVAAVVLLLVWLVVTSDKIHLGKADLRKANDESAQSRADLALLEILHPHLRSRATASVLDVMTGTARIPLLIAGAEGFAGAVVGVDLSRSMLARGRSIVRSRGLEERITLTEADAGALPYPDESFDIVTCIDAPVPSGKALGEMKRVLRPDGALLVSARTGRWSSVAPARVPSPARVRKTLNKLGLSTETLPWVSGAEIVVGKLSSRSRAPKAGRVL